MKILVNGLCGYMGREVEKLALSGYAGARLAGGVDVNPSGAPSVPCASSFDDAVCDVDCIIDFSHHDCTEQLLRFAVDNKLPLVLATTGQTDEEKAMIAEASKKIPLFFAANYSIGIALLIKLAVQTAKAMPDAEIEIIEKHHNRKIDAPSGTALAIASAIRSVKTNAEFVSGRSGMKKREKNEIGIHSVRMGNIVGEHEVIIGTPSQTITLKHEAHSRALFAEGALTAAAFLCSKEPGLYDMNSLMHG